MNRLLTMRRLTLIFAALFGIALLGVFAIQKFYVAPEKACVAEGRWWWAEERRCITPTYLPDITGRAPGVSRAEASDQKNRELLEIEARLEQERAAREAATARDRAAFEAKRPGV